MDEAKISILYAEDDEFGAKLTKTILEKENFDSFSFDYYSATIKNPARTVLVKAENHGFYQYRSG